MVERQLPHQGDPNVYDNLYAAYERANVEPNAAESLREVAAFLHEALQLRRTFEQFLPRDWRQA